MSVRQVRELALNAAQAFAVDDGKLRLLALEFSIAGGGVETVNPVARRVDRNCNATLLGDFERALFEAGIRGLHTGCCPVFVPSCHL